MEVTKERDVEVVLDDRLHLYGFNHFSEEAYERYEEKLESLKPDLVAAEDYPEKFVAVQLGFVMDKAESESAYSLLYALRYSKPVALVDRDWSAIEFGEYGTYQDLISDALSEAGLKEHEYGTASFREYTEINDAIAEHNPQFYRQFIPERDLSMASHLYWLMKNTPHDTILATMGIGHVENVLEHLQEIDQGKTQTTPQEPILYTHDELVDFVLPNKAIVKEAREQGGLLDGRKSTAVSRSVSETGSSIKNN